MAKAKMFVNGDLVTAATANRYFNLEVPPEAAETYAAANLTLLDTTNYQLPVGGRPPRVSRQGLRVALGGAFQVKTAGHLSSTFRRLYDLPSGPDYRPTHSVVDLVYLDNSQFVVILVNPDGGVHFIVNGSGASPANAVCHFNIGWDLLP
ncbi:MAG: hypothetical protein P1U38_09875 [Aeromicrobium sp.]|uniref:hypothetical protein n=1 Tax=Aeromicrobium sp. TaxID=1871063 RepID=UPI002639A954|nr:hypothetical protein [Aeromicrobium sp.]MDF1705070.1 hypothetical protein [Aeromicrobium sp.]